MKASLSATVALNRAGHICAFNDLIAKQSVARIWCPLSLLCKGQVASMLYLCICSNICLSLTSYVGYWCYFLGILLVLIDKKFKLSKN